MALVADTMGPMATVEADPISIHTNTKYWITPNSLQIYFKTD